MPSAVARYTGNRVPRAASRPHVPGTIPGRRLLIGLLGILVAAVAAISLPMVACGPADPALLDLGDVGTFALTDERGAPFNEAALHGHVTIVSFLFTRCDTICPVTTMKMARLQDKTFDAGAQIKLASFSVDPAYDTPDRLAAYAQRYHADAARWRFVTGPAETMRRLVEGPFMNSMAQDGVTASGAPQISHSGYFLLVDRDAHIRGAYDSNDIKRLDQMIRDARFLARTVR